MRILHVGWGFTPWRVRDGLISYSEDLMASQAERGDDVGYFLSGRHYPKLPGPRLKRWRRGLVAMYEVINSPIVPGADAGTRHPEREVSEPRVEAAFARTLSDFRPDVVHFEQLDGLPSSLIDVAADRRVPTVMTLQDYFPLCATTRLFDMDGQICMRRAVGLDCIERNSAAPESAAILRAMTLDYEIARTRAALHVPDSVDFSFVAPLVGRVFDWTMRGQAAPAPEEPALASPDAYQRRRDVNVRRLSRVDRLVAQSERVTGIYATLGVDPQRLSTLPFTLRHIENIRPNTRDGVGDPLTFATLGGCASLTKGSRVVLDAVSRLDGDYRLLVFGSVDADVRDELAAHPRVEIRGRYEPGDLDRILEEVDVGIIPSVWEEAFGYVGPELLAKGIPLIANPLGGITAYAIDGETAWLNESCSGPGLATQMRALIADPVQVPAMRRRVIERRNDFVTRWDDHVELIEDAYKSSVR
jgi:glycosyltransferase involved in cell wall biosynthesis